ncbi:MAG: hypothetical protein HQL50_11650 [Magnetococcales bacterium]|nr:hypothetical protein [Magnetococcales bacterium]
MRFAAAPAFNKDLPGASTTYRPGDLKAWADTPWDVRITLENMPLEEAFYLTLEEESLLDRPIAELLDKRVLTAAAREQLDVAEYPELPFIHDELRDLWQGVQEGRLTLDLHINKRPGHTPLATTATPRNHLSRCTFHNGAYDYRLLDLVWVLAPATADDARLKALQERFGAPFLILLTDFHQTLDAGRFPAIAPLLDDLLHQRRSESFPRLAAAFRSLLDDGLITVTSSTKAPPSLRLTDRGGERAHQLCIEADRLLDRYDPFASVSFHPPALGVPKGFDVRVQVMERDGIDLEHTLALTGWRLNGELLFDDENWPHLFEEGAPFLEILAALAYRTGFTPELLRALESLAADRR